jgi:hypothetical protein
VEKRTTFLVSRRAICQVIQPSNEPGFFHELRIQPKFRRRGYGLELLKFALQFTGEFLEMDIRYQSKVAQRLASRLKYQRVEKSVRYRGCDLWRYFGEDRTLPSSALVAQRVTSYDMARGQTLVVYLRAEGMRERCHRTASEAKLRLDWPPG